jgi:hypothetical protein
MTKFYVIVTTLQEGGGLSIDTDSTVVAHDKAHAISQVLAKHIEPGNTEALIVCAVSEAKAAFLERLARN